MHEHTYTCIHTHHKVDKSSIRLVLESSQWALTFSVCCQSQSMYFCSVWSRRHTEPEFQSPAQPGHLALKARLYPRKAFHSPLTCSRCCGLHLLLYGPLRDPTLAVLAFRLCFLPHNSLAHDSHWSFSWWAAVHSYTPSCSFSYRSSWQSCQTWAGWACQVPA